jgi:uncharacterized protein (UPF0332 family)
MMTDSISSRIKQFISLSERALVTAQDNLDSGDFRATVNRAYYAVFYAASAMLLSEGVERRRHAGIISAFREHFVKTGLVETEYSNIYGEVLVGREDADYAIEIPVDLDMAEMMLRQARRFVRRMLEYLAQRGYGDDSTQ